MNLRVFVRLFCLALFLSLAFSVSASAAFLRPSAATLPFPGAYPTIQATIDAAQSGDTVLVADGTYSGSGNRDIDFHGKNLTVTSQNGPTKTIIDCGGYTSTDGSGNHRGFYLHSGELSASISGFTIKNGYEASISSITDSGPGGGIYCRATDAGTITVINCNIIGNTASDGGGAWNDNYNNYGGGTITLISCTITGNVTTSGGGGGGIFNYGGAILVSKCAIRENTASFGGGVYNDNTNDSRTPKTIALINCIIANNTTALNPVTYGGGVYNNNLFGTTSLTNCTITRNAASYGGGAYSRNNNNGIIILTNDIIYGDTGDGLSDGTGSAPDISYSDIQGGYAGTGNINADPKFVSAAAGDLHLTPGSPCLGKGTTTGAPSTDFDGNPRPNPPSMGAYELGVPPAAIIGFTLSPNHLDVPGPNVFADVPVTGSFKSVSLTFAPGSFNGAAPTFKLNESSGRWTVSFPTSFLKLAKTNPITFIATGTRPDGSTASLSTTLQVGPLPKLTFSLFPDKTSIHRNETFTLRGYVSDLTTVPAPNTTVRITLPQGVSYVSSNGFTYDATARTLTLAIAQLAPNVGSFPVSVILQADINAPKKTPLVLAASVSCPGFQQAFQNAAVVVEAGLAPVGVNIIADGSGLLNGTAQVHSELGTPPLFATLTPVSGLSHIWLGVDYVIPAGGATAVPSSDFSVGSALGHLGLIAPDASPTYNATFQSLDSSVSIGVRLNDAAGVMNIASIFIQAASALAKYGPPPSTENILDVYDDIESVKAFEEAKQDLLKPANNPLQRLLAVGGAVKAIAQMDDKDTQTIAKIVLKLFGKDVKASQLRRFFKLLGRGETIFNLLQVLADETTLVIQTGGDDMVVTFKASPLHNSSSSSVISAVKQRTIISLGGTKL